MTETIDPLGLTCAEYAAQTARLGRSAGRAQRDYRTVFRTGTLCEGGARAEPPPITRRVSEQTPEGITTKFVQRVPGRPSESHPADPTAHVVTGSRPLSQLARELPELDIESVLIPMIGSTGRRSFTLCVSSQVGCAMGCEFCETAQMGLVRSLTPAEIVSQWFNATHGVGVEVKNFVFMGMGEPLDNWDAVEQAIRVLTDHNGPAIAMSNITVSTVGRIDGIRRLGELMREPGWRKLGLAISVNAPNDAVRSEIMPINRAMPMDDLRESLLSFPLVGKKKLCFEYVLIPGVNDARDHAGDLARWVAPFGLVGEDRPPRAMVNLIPYNPRRDSPWPAPDERDVDRFIAWLHEERVYVKRRRTKGRSRMAACGQLGTASIRKRRVVETAADTSA